MTLGFFTPAGPRPGPPHLINHLWQSTAVVLVAWLLTLSLRPNPARVRYAIWMIASIKFLFPFALLTSLGAHWATLEPHTPSRPFALYDRRRDQPAIPTRPRCRHECCGGHLPTNLPTSFLCCSPWFGFADFLAMLVIWIARWRRAAAMARSARAVADGREFDALRRAERNAEIRKPIPLVFSPSEVEPGIFGVMRPVLLWPIGLSERLDDARLQQSCRMKWNTCVAATT